MTQRRPIARVEGRFLYLRAPWHDHPFRGGHYDIDLNDVDSPEKLAAKICQLQGRPWFSRALCRELVLAVCSHFAWSLDDPALDCVVREVARRDGPAGS
jgi:hypothetical protein